MSEDLIGKTVTGVAATGLGIGREVEGLLYIWKSYNATIEPYFYIKVTDKESGERRDVIVLEHTIELVTEALEVNEHFLCFTEQEAELLKNMIGIAIPFWDVNRFLNFAQAEIGEASIAFMQKLDLISKEPD